MLVLLLLYSLGLLANVRERQSGIPPYQLLELCLQGSWPKPCYKLRLQHLVTVITFLFTPPPGKTLTQSQAKCPTSSPSCCLQLAEEYGNIYSLKTNSSWSVVLNGYKMVREALVTQGDTMADRPESALTVEVSNCPGVVTSNGYLWRQQRKFVLFTLKYFGVGKKSLESAILDEFIHLSRDIEELDGKPLRLKSKENAAAGFTEDNLIMCSLDLFVAGSETTSTTLRWSFLYMAKYPDVQEKVQAETDRVIGQSRLPTMADRADMPYTDAVIHEIQRIGNIAPLGLPRYTTKDVQLGDYLIPKGTEIIANLTSVMFDKEEWETPHTFNPGHFLNKEGKFVKNPASSHSQQGKECVSGKA
ncbi:hypothetical protein AALO_G00122960 [Alosa alosa]|uniref:Uncharacterized protein n=1 Tax=Alosa alosa TaxID=278164 RepID=A0AAV6GK93_9TELE|nr:hypothetical protein AALO_G00122960 [Alosa alosa]